MPVAITDVGYLIGRGVLKRPSGDDAVEVCKEGLYHGVCVQGVSVSSEQWVAGGETENTLGKKFAH